MSEVYPIGTLFAYDKKMYILTRISKSKVTLVSLNYGSTLKDRNVECYDKYVPITLLKWKYGAKLMYLSNSLSSYLEAKSGGRLKSPKKYFSTIEEIIDYTGRWLSESFGGGCSVSNHSAGTIIYIDITTPSIRLATNISTVHGFDAFYHHNEDTDMHRFSIPLSAILPVIERL